MKDLTVTIAGNVYQFSPLGAQDYQAVLEDYRKIAPDPVAVLVETSKVLPESLRDEFIRKHLDEAFAQKKKSGTLTDEGFETWLGTLDGAGALAHRSLRKNHGHLSVSQCLDIYSQGVAEYGQETFLALLSPNAKASA